MIIISRIKKKKNGRDIKLWTIIVSLGTIFFFAVIVSWITRNTAEEIDFFGITMDFRFLIFGLFVFLLGIITSFFILRMAKNKKKGKR